jgi:hypothetical protein
MFDDFIHGLLGFDDVALRTFDEVDDGFPVRCCSARRRTPTSDSLSSHALRWRGE